MPNFQKLNKALTFVQVAKQLARPARNMQDVQVCYSGFAHRLLHTFTIAAKQTIYLTIVRAHLAYSLSVRISSSRTEQVVKIFLSRMLVTRMSPEKTA
jgi:hypothetical protein